jgi:hypothetical protein
MLIERTEGGGVVCAFAGMHIGIAVPAAARGRERLARRPMRRQTCSSKHARELGKRPPAEPPGPSEFSHWRK